MARVFLSYAAQDRERARQLHQWLDAEGHEVFWDRDSRDGIAVGEEWDKRLHERLHEWLRWADAVVCVVTSASVTSTWCTAEISISLSRGSRLLPVRAEPGVDHPLLPSAQYQYADLTGDPDTAHAALAETLRRVDAAGGFGWPDDKSPFPGLRPLAIDEHQVFFGRRVEVEELAGLLRSPAERAEQAVLLVVGPSGCGKSSLVQAGLLHVMADEPGWLTLAPVLPGADPVAALARELAAAGREKLGWTVTQVRDQLDDIGLAGVADELLVAVLGGRRRRLLLVVDQFEELLTQTGSADRARFAELLRPALSGSVRVVATLRAEFLDQLLIDDDLAVLPTHPYPLRPLRREDLRRVIECPAQLAGFDVDEDLVALLVTDTDSGEALPLLAFTLAQLADGVTRGQQLSPERYKQLGGVQGALRLQADAALAEATTASGRSDEEVIAGLLRLVTVDEQERPTRWRVSHDELREPVILRELDTFIRRRLVTTDNDNGSSVVGVVHEAFLSAWPPLAQAIKENATALRARRAVEQAAADWDNNGRPADRLWERGRLAAALADTGAHLHAGNLVTDRVDLNQEARDFLRTSIRRDRLRRGRAVIVLSVLLILAVVAAGIAVVAQRAADRERNIAVSQRVAAQALELRASNPALAAQLSLAAYRLVPTADARGSLLSTAANPDVTRLTGHTSAVKGVAVSPDRHILATGSDDKTVRLWDISVPDHPQWLSTLTGHTNYVPSVAFSPDGHTLATASDDTTVRLWDVRDPHQPNFLGTVTGHTGVVYSVAFSSDGHTLATASKDTTVRLWDVRDPHQPTLLGTLTGHTGGGSSVAFSPDGHILAGANHDDRTTRLWDVRDPHQPTLLTPLTGHNGSVSSVAFSPDGATLATASYEDSTARLWDVRDPHQPSLLGTLTGHNGGVSAVAFSPDGLTLATSSQDTTARLWNIRDPHQPDLLGILTGHTDIVYSVAFSPDGRTLATGSYDKTARLWDLSGPIMEGHTNTVSSAAFSPDGRTLATGSLDKTTRLWDVRDPRQPYLLAPLPDPTGRVTSVALSPDGRTLATASRDDGTARLWDVRDPRQPNLLETLTGHDGSVYNSGVNGVTFSPDGHTVATASADNTVRLWDVRDLRQPSPLGALAGHTSSVKSVAFNPDGHTLASASADSTARLWETDIGKVTARICSTTPTITQDEWNQYLHGQRYQPPCP